MTERSYGEIPGYPLGSMFANRLEAARAGVHRPIRNGICGGRDGAESIVLSDGYPDDADHGDEIVYTGQGGRDRRSKRQVADQELTLGNAGLARSQLEGMPVRVIRGAVRGSAYAPASGYRYDGLFRVVDYWHEQGRDGFRIWRFRLVSLDKSTLLDEVETTDVAVPRIETTVQRIVRNSAVAREVKRQHDHHCQVCGMQLQTPAGPYSEGAHIRPLGEPHNGPDLASNMLCLCPNHHVLFDTGAIYIDERHNVRDTATNRLISPLRTIEVHEILWRHTIYHYRIHSL